MNFGAFAGGFAEGFDRGQRIGKSIRDIIKERELEELRETSRAEALAARDAAINSMITDQGEDADKSGPVDEKYKPSTEGLPKPKVADAVTDAQEASTPAAKGLPPLKVSPEVSNAQKASSASASEVSQPIASPESAAAAQAVAPAPNTKQPVTVLTAPDKSAPKGLLAPGTLDLNSRTVLKNPDGSISTEQSMSINVDGKEVLIPTIIGGQKVSDAAAIEHFKKTGEHLGIFDSPESANAYAEVLHNRQASFYGAGGTAAGGTSGVTTPMPNDDDMEIVRSNQNARSAQEGTGQSYSTRRQEEVYQKHRENPGSGDLIEDLDRAGVVDSFEQEAPEPPAQQSVTTAKPDAAPASAPQPTAPVPPQGQRFQSAAKNAAVDQPPPAQQQRIQTAPVDQATTPAPAPQPEPTATTTTTTAPTATAPASNAPAAVTPTESAPAPDGSGSSTMPSPATIAADGMKTEQPVKIDGRFVVNGKGYKTREEAVKAAQKDAPDVMSFYSKTLVPKMAEKMIARGEPDKAVAWLQWGESMDGRTYMKTWHDTWMAAQAGDYNAVAKGVVKMFNKYDNGQSLVADSKGKYYEEVKDKNGTLTGFNIRLKNDNSGEVRSMFIDPKTLVNLGVNGGSPEKAFELNYKRQIELDKAEMEAKIKANDRYLQFKQDIIKQDRREDREDTRAAFKADRDNDREDRRDARTEKQEAARDKRANMQEDRRDARSEKAEDRRDARADDRNFKKPTDPQERRALIQSDLAKNDSTWTRKSEAERKKLVDEGMRIVYGDDAVGTDTKTDKPAPAGKPVPSLKTDAKPGTNAPAANPRHMVDPKTREVYRVEGDQYIFIGKLPPEAKPK